MRSSIHDSSDSVKHNGSYVFSLLLQQPIRLFSRTSNGNFSILDLPFPTIARLEEQVHLLEVPIMGSIQYKNLTSIADSIRKEVELIPREIIDEDDYLPFEIEEESVLSSVNGTSERRISRVIRHPGPGNIQDVPLDSSKVERKESSSSTLKNTEPLASIQTIQRAEEVKLSYAASSQDNPIDTRYPVIRKDASGHASRNKISASKELGSKVSPKKKTNVQEEPNLKSTTSAPPAAIDNAQHITPRRRKEMSHGTATKDMAGFDSPYVGSSNTNRISNLDVPLPSKKEGRVPTEDHDVRRKTKIALPDQEDMALRTIADLKGNSHPTQHQGRTVGTTKVEYREEVSEHEARQSSIVNEQYFRRKERTHFMKTNQRSSAGIDINSLSNPLMNPEEIGHRVKVVKEDRGGTAHSSSDVTKKRSPFKLSPDGIKSTGSEALSPSQLGDARPFGTPTRSSASEALEEVRPSSQSNKSASRIPRSLNQSPNERASEEPHVGNKNATGREDSEAIVSSPSLSPPSPSQEGPIRDLTHYPYRIRIRDASGIKERTITIANKRIRFESGIKIPADKWTANGDVDDEGRRSSSFEEKKDDVLDSTHSKDLNPRTAIAKGEQGLTLASNMKQPADSVPSNNSGASKDNSKNEEASNFYSRRIANTSKSLTNRLSHSDESKKAYPQYSNGQEGQSDLEFDLEARTSNEDQLISDQLIATKKDLLQTTVTQVHTMKEVKKNRKAQGPEANQETRALTVSTLEIDIIGEDKGHPSAVELDDEIAENDFLTAKEHSQSPIHSMDSEDVMALNKSYLWRYKVIF